MTYTGTQYSKESNIPQYIYTNNLGGNGIYCNISSYFQSLTRWLSDLSLRIIPSGAILTNSEFSTDNLYNIESQIFENFSIDIYKTLIYDWLIPNNTCIHYTNCIMLGTGNTQIKQYNKISIDLLCKYTGTLWELSNDEFIESSTTGNTEFNTILILYDIITSTNNIYAKNIPLGIWYTDNTIDISTYINTDTNFYSIKSSLILDLYTTLSTNLWEENNIYNIYIHNTSDPVLSTIIEKLGTTVEKYLAWITQCAAIQSKRRELFISYQKQKNINSI